MISKASQVQQFMLWALDVSKLPSEVAVMQLLGVAASLCMKFGCPHMQLFNECASQCDIHVRFWISLHTKAKSSVEAFRNLCEVYRDNMWGPQKERCARSSI